MADNALSLKKVAKARRGSKKGWVMVGGQLPPKLGAAFLQHIDETQTQQTDAVYVAVAEYLDRRGVIVLEDEDDRRTGDDRRLAKAS